MSTVNTPKKPLDAQGPGIQAGRKEIWMDNAYAILEMIRKERRLLDRSLPDIDHMFAMIERPPTTGKRKSVLDPFESLLGVLSDEEIAKRAGSSVNNVRAYRFRRGIRVGRAHPPGHVAGRPVVLTSMRSRILLWLKLHGPARSEDVAKALLPDTEGSPRQHVYGQVYRLFREGKLLRQGRGTYAFPPEKG